MFFCTTSSMYLNGICTTTFKKWQIQILLILICLSFLNYHKPFLKKQNGWLNSDLRVQDPYWNIYKHFKRSQMKQEWIWVKTNNLAFEQWASSAFYRLLLLPAFSRNVFQEIFYNSSYTKWQITPTLSTFFSSLESNTLFCNIVLLFSNKNISLKRQLDCIHENVYLFEKTRRN